MLQRICLLLTQSGHGAALDLGPTKCLLMTQSGHRPRTRTAFCKVLFGSASISVLGCEPFRRVVRERKLGSGLQMGSISRLELEARKRRYERSIRECG